MKRTSILGTQVDHISLDTCLETIIDTVESDNKLRIVTANPEMIYIAEEDEKLRNIINAADIVVPDGIGVLWAARLQKANIKERVTGVDLALKILEEGHRRGWRVFLLGAKPGVAAEAVNKQYKCYPGITFGCHHGYFAKEEEHVVTRKISRFAPDVLFAGLGVPQQEYWLAENSNLAKVSIGIGGTIDVMAGRIKRAPSFFRKTGLEWFYRLLREPYRIKRQKVLPLYLYKVIRQRLSSS